MPQEVNRILIDTAGTCTFKFILAHLRLFFRSSSTAAALSSLHF
jgi:hypothetical protein